MEGFREALRVWAGKQTEGARRWFASLGAWIKEKKREITPRRVVTIVIALSLWIGTGRMRSSGMVEEDYGEVFGELHRYPPEQPQGIEGEE
jgi:hypothetical protein